MCARVCGVLVTFSSSSAAVIKYVTKLCHFSFRDLYLPEIIFYP